MLPLDVIHPDLIAAFPMLRGRLPWLRLGSWPTPVSRLDTLGREAGAELWVKHDEVSGALHGGNKVRKLEPLLAEALAQGATGVLTVGGIGSNHAVACGVYARELGLARHAVVFPQPVTDAVRRTVRLLAGLGVRLHPCGSRLAVPIAMARARAPGLYVVGPGGSSPLGTLGFVAGALELASQVRQGLLPEPALLFVPLGSGGTVAGLALGCAAAGLRTRIVAVAVVERVLGNAALLGLLLARTARLLRRLGARVPAAPAVRVLHGYLGRGYGDPTDAAARACCLARDLGGLELETTYSGKALAALLEHARRAEGPVLFWNTHNARDTHSLLDLGPGDPLPERLERWLGD